ncbi:hypothetical protein L227DRAFT_580639 [Lentinus tigrinus ALCF2SS1-6]|uniref:Origin recognition complex subunit 1 n=1 Tax=Lentinus tigrinus ALCF2SS1-6 TaxID=1328759 RepID=A0A5C2RS04_9APHY|nr:hypothetical protein L227DRAFT_580639 [Lentinus tigrinus ALCF2SS1-6]
MSGESIVTCTYKKLMQAAVCGWTSSTRYHVCLLTWPTLANSKLVVLAIANTMNLTERVMTASVRSRLGMVRINFPQFKQIVQGAPRRIQSSSARQHPNVLATDTRR